MRVELTSHDLNDQLISRLLEVERMNVWGHADAVAALRHQLAAKLLPDLAALRKTANTSAPQTSDGHNPWESSTFGGQLLSRNPALEVLLAIKEFGRSQSQDQNSPLAGPAAVVLYYAAIAAAKLRLDLKITQLADRELVDGFSWAITREGAESLIPLFRDAMDDITT